MGIFSPRRNPEDPHQLAIAVHELGHGFAWQGAGLTVRGVTFSGDDGDCRVRYYTKDLRDYAVGLWAGFEAEDRWRRAHDLGRASLGRSSHDIREFRKAVSELDGKLSEDKARNLARERVAESWRQIERLAPELVRRGEISI